MVIDSGKISYLFSEVMLQTVLTTSFWSSELLCFTYLSSKCILAVDLVA